MTPPVDSKGAAIAKILDNFRIDCYLANKEGGSLMDEELETAHKEATNDILAILAQEVKRVRIEELEWLLAHGSWLGDKHDVRNYIEERLRDFRKAGLV